MSEPFAKKSLAGWGRFQPKPCIVYRPEQRAALRSIITSGECRSYIGRGLGRSYGDTSVNDGAGVIDFTRLDRMLSFDAETGVLECEAGVSLADIIDIFLPRGFFLPVTPGTKYVTAGGAIANDVHGKNHHRDGTFGKFVTEFTLQTPAGETITCTPENNADIFWATVGGIGLTGIVLTAKFRMQRVESAYVTVDYHKSRDLDDALATMAGSDANYQYSVAWVDCLASGKHLGRSVLMRGNHTPAAQVPAATAGTPLHAPRKRSKSVPFEFPGFVLNPLTVRAFNQLLYSSYGNAQGRIVDYDSYFYPLDAVLQWNRLYGKNGFVQYQATLPPESVRGLVLLLERLSASRRASFLAVLKCFGEANPGMLSHPMKGYTLTLDIPNKRGLVPFLHELDRILLDHGGRLYRAKDATARPETIEAMYPRLNEFRAIKARLDPDNALSSTMARRLGIVPA